ncbi:MAG: hypothetical protein ABIS67_09760 [Candidatus Eisenbacteria bacterium]
MHTHSELRIEPPAAIVDATRTWLTPVREGIGPDFLSAYLTGSVLTQGFDPRTSRINVLVISRVLDTAVLERLSRAIPVTRKAPHFEPLFMARVQIEKSLDVFPIEWLEMQERHLLLEGEDVLSALEVPRTYLRLQCEHELRGKHIQLRQALLLNRQRPLELSRVLSAAASSYATLFRTLLRISGEDPPAESARVVERVADVFRLDAAGLLIPHMLRYGGRTLKRDEAAPQFRRFVAEIDHLIAAIDELRLP